ncbi:MAG: metal ABC transporter permease, partial [Anaerolineaceae bacterium]
MSFEEWFPRLIQASLTTLYMVGVSTLLTVLFGLPLGILLVVSDSKGLSPKPALNKILGVVVNLTRSLPFIILLVVLI